MIDLNKPRLTDKNKIYCIAVDCEMCTSAETDCPCKQENDFYDRLQELENAIEDGELVPVVRGEWIEHEDEMECPQCGYFWNYCDNDTERFNCCPNCGAKMEVEP